MKSVPVEVGARGVDSYPYSVIRSEYEAADKARRLREAGIDFVVGYLGVIQKGTVQAILDAGLGFMPVTVANAFNVNAALVQLQALGIPKGTTVWLDVEGKTVHAMEPSLLIGKCNAWADKIDRAEYVPGIYVGSPQPLTSSELWNLKMRRYWNALSREQDRFGNLAEPKCGWCMWQMHPQKMWRDTGVFVDVNIVGQDFLGRVPSMAVKG